MLITVSGCLQLGNILTIEWGVANYIGRIQEEEGRRLELKKANKPVNSATLTPEQLKILPLFTVSPSDPTQTYVDLSEIMRRMGMDENLMRICFPGYEEPQESWFVRMHHHPHCRFLVQKMIIYVQY